MEYTGAVGGTNNDVNIPERNFLESFRASQSPLHPRPPKCHMGRRRRKPLPLVPPKLIFHPVRRKHLFGAISGNPVHGGGGQAGAPAVPKNDAGSTVGERSYFSPI
jgi:hypothetical protein